MSSYINVLALACHETNVIMFFYFLLFDMTANKDLNLSLIMQVIMPLQKTSHQSNQAQIKLYAHFRP